MPRREWISKEHKIFRLPSGKVYARESIPGLGRKEFALNPKVQSVREFIREKQRRVAAYLRANEPKAKSLVRVDEIAAEILKLKMNRAEATQVSAELHFRKHILPWFNEHCPYMNQVNEAVVEEYILAQQILNPSRKLFNDIKHLRMLVKHAFKRGILTRPVQIRDPDPERDAGRRLSQVEVDALLANAARELRGQILMAVTMGMRKSEILLLSWDRVDLEKKTIHLRAQDTKIRRSRTMGMSERVATWMDEARNLPANPAFVFGSRVSPDKPSRSNKSAWTACKRRAGVTCRFHDLRHTFLSVALLERRQNPLHVSVYAGVSLQEIQKTYLHPSVEDTRYVALDWGTNGGAEK